MLDIYALYMKPISTLRAWVREVRGGKRPIMPTLAHDEIGALGIEISSVLASYMETRELNSDLSAQKSLFTTLMAHQLRTPLTGLMWSIDALLKPETPTEERDKLLVDLSIILKRMRLIIEHILATANVEGGQFGFVMQQTDLVPIAQKLVADFKPVADDRGLQIIFDHPENLPQVYADPERISIALFDLLSNAVDYTPRGGSVTVALAPGKDRVYVTVADTGIGIPSAELPLLFNRFYRGENARHMRPDGTGLGLYLVKQIITAHGSEISVQSNAKGSRFSFYLSTRKPS
jgi:signal transduction histidine kinase